MRPLPTRSMRLAPILPILIAFLVALPLALALTLLTAGHALACPVCGPPDKVTISGSELARPLTITDPTALDSFGVTSFFGTDDRASIAPPRTTGTGDATGYEVTRYYHQFGASYWTGGFDHLRYYPPTTPGATGATGAAGHGLIYYEGPIAGDTQHFAAALGLASRTGKWFTATPAEDAAMRSALGAPATSAAPPAVATSPAPSATTSPFAAFPVPSPGSLVAVAAVLVVLGTLALMLRGNLGRRRHSHPAPPAEAPDAS